MANIELLRPTTVTGQILTGASAVKIGTTSTADFLIKIAKAGFRFAMPSRETSGDGDAAPAHQGSYWRYDSFRLMGFVPAPSVATFPLANIIDSTKNPILTSNMKVNFATNAVLTYPRALIEVFEIFWVRGDGALDIIMMGKATDSHATWGTT